MSRDGGSPSNDLFMFVDLDNFKAVNDSGGHAAGDLLLKRVDDAIRSTIRSGDVAARLGGDEFAVILRGCDLESGTAMAEKLIAMISQLATTESDAGPRIGASVGLTSIGRGETDVDTAIARADLACYQAKASGRGRVTVIEAPAGAKGKARLARAS
jgi:diguanylate cyclase (GGDEF)-like protein